MATGFVFGEKRLGIRQTLGSVLFWKDGGDDDGSYGFEEERFDDSH
jgi:hypothetical protein